MNISQQIERDYVQAFKQKNELAVLTLRQLKTALKNAEITKNREDLTIEDVTKILKTEVKRRKDAVELYRQGGRDELAKKEETEIGIIQKYLPAELGENEVKEKVKAIIAQLGATGPAEMGKVMGKVMAELHGQADGGLVNRLVKDELGRLAVQK